MQRATRNASVPPRGSRLSHVTRTGKTFSLPSMKNGRAGPETGRTRTVSLRRTLKGVASVPSSIWMSSIQAIPRSTASRTTAICGTSAFGTSSVADSLVQPDSAGSATSLRTVAFMKPMRYLDWLFAVKNCAVPVAPLVLTHALNV